MSTARNFVHKTKDIFHSFWVFLVSVFWGVWVFFERMVLEVCQILHKNSLDFVKMKHVGLSVSKNEARMLQSCVCNC